MNLENRATTERAHHANSTEASLNLVPGMENGLSHQRNANLLPPLACQISPEKEKKNFVAKTILLVEDYEALRDVYTLLLNMVGYSVVACCDAQTASLAFSTNVPIDVLMSDLEMPGRSGLELARELTGLRPSLPVLIVSGAWPSNEMFSEIQEREWKFLSKPCGLPSVIATLELLLHEHSLKAVA